VKTSKTFLLVLLFACAGCHRTPPDSEDFQAAFELYNQLYAASLDDSYSDARMLRVVDLLNKVDPASAQAAEAKDLLEKVQKGIAEAKARADRVAADQKAADAPAKFTGGTTFETPKPPMPAAAAGPSLGMTRDEFTAKFGDCFERKGDYEQGEKRGEAFGLVASCKERFPAFAESLVILVDNKVATLMPMTEVTVRTVDAGPPPPPPPAPAGPAPVPTRFLPGAPVPTAPSAGTPPPVP
jgi:uncharacterized protein YktA (UPF0223 family)